MVTATLPQATTPKQLLEAAAMARLHAQVELHGITSPQVLDTLTRWGSILDDSATPEPVRDDLADLVDATAEPPLVAPALLANARAEHERRVALAVIR